MVYLDGTFGQNGGVDAKVYAELNEFALNIFTGLSTQTCEHLCESGNTQQLLESFRSLMNASSSLEQFPAVTESSRFIIKVNNEVIRVERLISSAINSADAVEAAVEKAAIKTQEE
ncbi:hypothetical protein TRVL_10107 [Trypanosoma vivax]|nr:hypothetical protein TRVL_10107 [Trypanosoma vivax]